MTHARIVVHVVRWLVAVLTLLAASEVAAGGEVAGRVVDPEGRPVKGAKVYLLARDDEGGDSFTEPVASAAEGTFVLVGVSEAKEHYPHQLVASADGYGVGTVYVQNGKRPEVKLSEAIEVTVPFLDEEGKAVKDLSVRVHQVMMSGGLRSGSYVRPPKGMGGVFAAQTDGNGEVRMKQMPRGGRLWLAVDDERFARLSIDSSFILSNEETMRAQPIKLVRAASVKGRVTYEDGRAVSGVKVSAQGVEEFGGWGDAISDGEGFYQIRQMGAGSYNIALDLQKVNRMWTARAHEAVNVAVGQEKRAVDFKLIPGAVIKGKAMAADNGEPIAGMHIMVYGPAHPKTSGWVQSSITAADGSYFLRVPAGEQYLYVGMSQAPDGYLMTAKKEQTVKVSDGEILVFDFPFPRGPKMPVVSGRVVDEDGKAVGGCTISIEPSGRTEPGRAFPYEKQSAADGSFQFKLLYPEVKVRAKKDQMATLAATAVKGPADQQIDLKLEMNALSGISGTVVDARGDLLAGAKIQLTVMYGSSGEGRDTAATGREGTFKIDGLWADGWYAVDISAPGRGEYKSRKLELKPGEVLDLGRVVVKDLDSFISGTVFDLNGNPAAGIKVSINGTKMTPLVVTQTDKDGKFRIPAVSGDAFDLYANFGEGSISSRKVTAGEENIQLFQRVRRR